jgi:serine/threonine protein kinase
VTRSSRSGNAEEEEPKPQRFSEALLQRSRRLSAESHGNESSSKTGNESSLLARRRNQRPGLELVALRVRGAPGENGRTASHGLEDVVHQDTQSIRILDPGQKIYDLYYWDEVIQEEGCGGKVVICTPKVFGEESPLTSKSWRDKPERRRGGGTHVMKIKAKAELSNRSEEQFRKAQLKMLNMPPHNGVLPLHEVLEDDNFYYVAMEKANGGGLLSSLLEEFSDGIMPESAVKKLMKEILLAIGHMHKTGILHRDIKPDNLVVQVYNDQDSPTGKVRQVKIIDFDVADPEWTPMSPSKKCNWAGTLRNSAPETFKGYFSQRTDLYSIGLILYLLMAGRPPYDDAIFDGHGEFDALEDIYVSLRDTRIDFEGSCWDHNPLCRDFCKMLLEFDPELRPASAEEALLHEWFRHDRSKSPEGLQEKMCK